MKIKATPICAADLKPGDLFSNRGPEYWDLMTPGAIGEKVYIRTETPADVTDDYWATVYKIEVIHDDSETKHGQDEGTQQ